MAVYEEANNLTGRAATQTPDVNVSACFLQLGQLTRKTGASRVAGDGESTDESADVRQEARLQGVVQ